ncbi:MAG: DUF4271 domain-containing protein [Gloeobacteraceae cyanobacterium ES-bin-316]|nr:DUF4271 domain-containing protein [Ferruginibacter sp.]
MKKNLLFVFYWLVVPIFLFAQTETDTISGKQDSLQQQEKPVKPIVKDSIRLKKKPDTARVRRDSLPVVSDTAIQVAVFSSGDNLVYAFQELLRNHPTYKFFGKSLQIVMQERKYNGNEPFFYLLLILFFYYGLIRVVFSKYLGDLFTLFFRATLRQQQLREQLLQNPLPSLLLNIQFLLTGSLYAALLARYNNLLPQTDFWILCLYCLAILVSIYLVKFMVLKTMGWVLRINRATDVYLFIVFMVNKMTGIFLLPILLMMAFPYTPIVPAVIALSLFVLALLLGYRFFVSYRLVRNEIKLNLFHFFLYLCAFEIAPLLLIYKALLTFVERTF